MASSTLSSANVDSARRAFPVRNALPQQRGAATTDVGIKVLYAHEA